MPRGRYPRGFHQYLARSEVVELLRYLLQHPESTKWQIMEDTSLSQSDVASLVPQLANKGIIISSKNRRTNTFSISGLYVPSLTQDISGGL